MYRLRLVLGPFANLLLHPDHPASLPLLGVRIPPVTATLATPTTAAITITASSGAGVFAPLGDVPPSSLTPHFPLRLPTNLPHDAAAPGAGRIPVANIPIGIPPAALDPEVVLAPPPPIEVDSPADLSRSGARLTFFAPAWVAAPQSIRTIVTRGFHWTWLDRPPILRPPGFTQSRPDLSLPVQDWVTKGVIYPVPPQSCFQSRIFTVPRPDGRPPPPHYRLVTTQSVYPSPTIPSRQPLHARPGPPAPSSHGGVGHFGGLHTYPHPPQPSLLPGLVPQPTLFLSGSPIRPLRIQGINILAYLDDIVLWHPSPVILRQHVARTIERLSVMGFRVNLPKSQLEPQTTLQWLGILWHPQTGHWQASQPIRDKIQSSTHQLLQRGRITRRRLEALVGLINFACQVHSHLRVYLQPLTVGSSLASPQDRDVSRPIPPTLRQALQFWVDPSIWEYVPPFQVTLPLLFLWTDASRSGWGALLHPQATAHGLWGLLEAALHINVLELRAVSRAITTFNLSSCHLVVYTDNETVRFTLTHLCTRSLPPVTGGTERSFTRHDQATGVCSPAPHPHHSQCGSGRPEPARTAQHGVDAASRGLPSDPSLGRSPSSRSPGLSDELPSSAVGLPLPSPGCSGLQLSKFQLERLRQHLCVPASRLDSDSAATNPRLQRTSCAGGSLGPTRALVAISPPAGSRPPTPADDAIPTLRTRPGLPQVGDLRAMDRISFLRQALLTSPFHLSIRFEVWETGGGGGRERMKLFLILRVIDTFIVMGHDIPNIFFLGPADLYVLCTYIVFVLTLIFLFSLVG